MAYYGALNMSFHSLQYTPWFFLLLLFVVIYLRASKQRKTILSEFSAMPGVKISGHHWSIKKALVLVGTLFTILALLGPYWDTKEIEITRRGSDIYVLVDTSSSMNATDVTPSRMERVKFKLKDFSAMIEEDRVGLIPFAGTAFVACPLTTDREAFELFIDELGTDFIPYQGTNIAAGVQLAAQSFEESPASSRAVIILTDGGLTVGDQASLIETAKTNEIRLFVVGVGSLDGAPIPDAQGGFKKDQAGNIVLSKLEESSLAEIAVQTGGSYVRMVAGDEDWTEIYKNGVKKNVDERDLKGGVEKVPIERYIYPLIISLLCFLIVWIWD